MDTVETPIEAPEQQQPVHVTYNWLPDEPKVDLTIPAELSEAAEALRAVREREQQARTLLHSAQEELDDLKREAAEAKALLAESEAAAVVSGAAPDETPRSRFLGVRDKRDIVEARAEGLRQRILSAVQDRRVAESILAKHWRTWREKIQNDFLSSIYLPAAQQFIGMLGLGLSLSLDNREMGEQLYRMVLRCGIADPANPTTPLNRNFFEGFWKNDENSQALYGEINKIRADLGIELLPPKGEN